MIQNRLSELLEAKTRREGHQWTIFQLSEATGVWRSTLENWLSGKAKAYSADAIVKLCDFLECDIGDLLVFVEDEDIKGEGKSVSD